MLRNGTKSLKEDKSIILFWSLVRLSVSVFYFINTSVFFELAMVVVSVVRKSKKPLLVCIVAYLKC